MFRDATPSPLERRRSVVERIETEITTTERRGTLLRTPSLNLDKEAGERRRLISTESQAFFDGREMK